MQRSESFAQVAAALATAQAQFPTIPRDRTVTVKTKGRDGQPGGQYTFRYAPLETILDKVRNALGSAGLALVQAIELEETPNGGSIEVLRTTLIHSSGEWFANVVPIFVGTGDNKAQAYASGVTYSRRYGVTLLLCVAADEDDDGNEGDQQGDRPDYERSQTREPYRGSFPRQGGGRSQPPQQTQAGPRPPQRREPQPDPVTGEALPFPLADDPSEAPLFGEDLSPGQLSMLRAAQMAASLDDAGVLAVVGGPISAATFRDANAKLKAKVNEVLGA